MEMVLGYSITRILKDLSLDEAAMTDSHEEEINIHAINFKEDDASAQGTITLCCLVQKLHKAQRNPSLQPTIKVTIKGQIFGSS